MAGVGSLALEKLQAGLETTRMTAVPATRKVYGTRGNAWWEPTVTKQMLNENMSSYVKNYRHVVTEVSGKVTVPFFLTAADFPWWGQLFLAGGVAGSVIHTAAYTYTQSPITGTGAAVTSDNLKTATFEAYSDTQGYQLPGCLGEKLEITWARGKVVDCSAELLAQQAIAQAVTAGIVDRTGLNPLVGTSAVVAIDAAGGTMGNTPFATPLGGKITFQNNWTTIAHNKGQLYYDDAVREPRSVTLELDYHFKDQTEFSHLLDDAERLIQVSFTGPVISGATPTTNESVVFQFYGYHLTAPFGVDKAIRTVKLTAESQFDTTAGTDWSVISTNALVTLP